MASDSGGILRTKKDKDHPYFLANQTPFNDKKLSWEARGVLAYLLSKPDDWQVRCGDLVKQGKARRYKLRRILKELEAAGYLERQRVNQADGTFEWVTNVYETPRPRKEEPAPAFQGLGQPSVNYPPVAEPPMGEPPVGEPPTVNRPIYKGFTILNTEQTKQGEQQTAAVVVSDNDSSLRSLLTDFGYDAATAERLMDAYDADFVRRWVAYAKRQPNLRNPLGFVRAKLRTGESPPRVLDREDPDFYVSGKYAEFVES